MRTQKKGRIAFAVCGSFCTLEAALAAAQQLTEQGWELLPIMSFAAKQDTRFGTGQFWQERLEALTGHAVLDTLQAVEPLGPKKLVSALVIAPCTGATLARWAFPPTMGWERRGITSLDFSNASITILCPTGRMTPPTSPTA